MTSLAAAPDVSAAVDVLRARLDVEPAVLIVLGSGLGGLASLVEEPAEVPFAEVPGLPDSTVSGHSGRFVAGRLDGVPVLLQAGRFHMYEGHAPQTVASPARIAAGLGVEAAVVTNAAGGVHRMLEPGDVMLLDDHVNLTWRNPLIGPVSEGEVRFPDMSAPYDGELQESALASAREHGITLARGTYVAVLGPSYETPAEVRMIERIGGDAVGMSTVPEVLALRAGGIRVVALSLITNRAAGTGGASLSHAEVLETAAVAGDRLGRIVRGVVTSAGRAGPGPK